MKLKFRHKVFFAFLLNSLLIVICMLLIGRHYAHRNFEDYVRKVEMERLDELATALSKEYVKGRNWESVLEDWDDWLQSSIVRPRRLRGAFGKPPPPPFPFLPPGWRDPGKGERARPGPPHRAIESRLSLFDADRRLLAGAAASSVEDYRMKPILVEGQPVGWLGIRKLERLTHPLDLEFLSSQSRMFYSIGSVALLLAMFVTLVLSRRILSPVKRLAEGTRALASRRFDTRIEVRSQDEFGQLAADFNAMAQALERDERLRRQWVADVAHELRTPLAILRGEIEAMQDGVREVTPEALESLHFEALHVGRIVDDLHDLSLIESRDLDKEPVPVKPLEVLEETLKAFRTRLEQRKVRIELNDGNGPRTMILADADRLRQLFSNLLENTLRYADAPGVLRITHERTAGSLRLRFEDSGPGVPEASLERLFDRLYRVDTARSRAHGGSGLGLAICKSIVERFGGRIEASNAPSGGLRIGIVFPVLSGWDGTAPEGCGRINLGSGGTPWPAERSSWSRMRSKSRAF